MSTHTELKPYLLSDFTQTEKEGELAMEVHIPQCPICLNADGRLTLKHDKKNATIIITESFETSGHNIVKCLCCDMSFKWSSRNVDYERQNDVLVPIEYFSKMLGVDVYKYL
jgi:hypothetical protein